MKLVCSIAAVLVNTSKGVHGSVAARRISAEMFKELKTKVLRLLPPTSNGPTVHRDETGTCV